MTEPQDRATDQPDGRTPHTEQPAEGADSQEPESGGRTPHSEQPAEGPDTGQEGVGAPS